MQRDRQVVLVTSMLKKPAVLIYSRDVKSAFNVLPIDRAATFLGYHKDEFMLSIPGYLGWPNPCPDSLPANSLVW